MSNVYNEMFSCLSSAAVLTLFGLRTSSESLKLLRTPKTLCLCGFYLPIFTTLKQKPRNLKNILPTHLKIAVMYPLCVNINICIWKCSIFWSNITFSDKSSMAFHPCKSSAPCFLVGRSCQQLSLMSASICSRLLGWVEICKEAQPPTALQLEKGEPGEPTESEGSPRNPWTTLWEPPIWWLASDFI